jgi:CBS domain-containing protein
MLMSERQIRRLPVVDGGRRLVGVISLADIARSDERARNDASDAALSGISRPGGEHNQSLRH